MKAGDLIRFEGEVQRYRIRCRGERFMVCTKPFNPKHTVLYTVVDLEEKIRGTENLVFGLGAETDSECQDMLDRIEGGLTAVSRRNRVPLQIIGHWKAKAQAEQLRKELRA